MQNALVFINTTSGSNQGDDLITFFEKSNQDGLFPNNCIQLVPGKTDIQKEIKDHSPEIVIVAGGDGSVNYVAPALFNSDIPLGVFPTGSANGLATEFGLPSQIDKAVLTWRDGEIKLIDVIKVNDGKWWCLHFADFGINAKLVKHNDEQGTSGMFGYFSSFLQTIDTEQGITFSIKTSEGEEIVDAVMVAIANARKLGTGGILYPKGNTEDSKLGVITFHPFNSWGMIETTVAFFRGNVNELNNVTHSEHQWVKITPHRDIPLQIDGETIETDDSVFKFEVLPKALKVLVPKKS